MNPELELALHRFQNQLGSRLAGAREVEDVLRSALRAVQEFFAASDACLAVLIPGADLVEPRFVIPRGAAFDLPLLTSFVRVENPEPRPGLLMAPILRRGRAWAVVALGRTGGFEPGAGRALARVAAALSDLVARIDHERTAEVRARIDRKIMACRCWSPTSPGTAPRPPC